MSDALGFFNDAGEGKALVSRLTKRKLRGVWGGGNDGVQISFDGPKSGEARAGVYRRGLGARIEFRLATAPRVNGASYGG